MYDMLIKEGDTATGGDIKSVRTAFERVRVERTFSTNCTMWYAHERKMMIFQGNKLVEQTAPTVSKAMKLLKVMAAVSKVIVAIGPLVDLGMILLENEKSEKALTEKEMRRIVIEETAKAIKKFASWPKIKEHTLAAFEAYRNTQDFVSNTTKFRRYMMLARKKRAGRFLATM